MHEPELLVLDEPLSGLDPSGIDAIGRVLVDQARAGCCVLFSSHQLDLVEDLCELVTIIDHGRVVVSGTVDELASSGARRLVVRVEGDRQAAWAGGLPGVSVSEVAAGEARLVLDDEVDSDTVLRGRNAGWPGYGVHLRTSAPLRSLPGGVGVKFVFVVPILVLALGLRLWLPRRRRAHRAGEAEPPELAATGRAFSDSFDGVGLVALREIRERVRGRIFRIGTLVILLAVGAAIVIPAIHRGTKAQPENVAVVGPPTSSLRSLVEKTAAGVGTTVKVVDEANAQTAERGAPRRNRRRRHRRWPTASS